MAYYVYTPEGGGNYIQDSDGYLLLTVHKSAASLFSLKDTLEPGWVLVHADDAPENAREFHSKFFESSRERLVQRVAKSICKVSCTTERDCCEIGCYNWTDFHRQARAAIETIG